MTVANVYRQRFWSIFVFALHQVMGTYGSLFVAAYVMYALLDLQAVLHLGASKIFFQNLLTENPFYPLQILTALCLGWGIQRRLPHPKVYLVWILPALILGYVVVTGFRSNPEWSSILLRPGFGQSRLTYYFGWGCHPRLHCIDQLVLTAPFYASIAYSLGAWISNKRRRPGTEPMPESNSNVQAGESA